MAVYATNSLAYLDLWMACGTIGAILQTLNWRLTPAELEGLIRDAAPVALAYSGSQPKASAGCARRCPACAISSPSTPAAPGDCPFAGADTSPATLQAPRPDLDWDSPWVICYTGGTTGRPKGDPLARQHDLEQHQHGDELGAGSGRRRHPQRAIFHTGGLNVFTLPLVHIGGTNILCRGFDVDQVFDLIESGAATLYFGVPTMFVLMQQHPRWPEMDFSRLKLVINGGAPCPMPVFERFWAKGVDFKTGYGLTEAGPNTFWLPAADVRRNRARSASR